MLRPPAIDALGVPLRLVDTLSRNSVAIEARRQLHKTAVIQKAVGLAEADVPPAGF